MSGGRQYPWIEEEYPAASPLVLLPGAASYKFHLAASYGPDLTAARVRVIQAAREIELAEIRNAEIESR